MGVKIPCLDCGRLIEKAKVRRCPECQRRYKEKARLLDPRRGRLARQVRARALARDHRRCQGCGKHQRQLDTPLEVHHRNGKADDHRMENLTTLCRECHREADRRLGIQR